MKFYLLLCALFLQEIGFGCAKIRNDCACGESNTRTSGRIVNGKQTSPNKYPWMAAMFTQTAFMCGGAIISDRTILTAGHCIFYVPDPFSTYWVLGMHDQRIKDGTIYNVASAMLHPKFTNHTVYDDYDMAMVALTRKIRFTRTVKPICLPKPNDDFTGKSGVVAGWGRLSEDPHALMGNLLQETKIRVKPNDECRVETKRLVNFNTESMVCGFQFNSDACQGDSGGPFFIETDPNRYEVFGVVSFGDGCARSFPGIYGRLSETNTLNWIKQFIRQWQGDVCRDPREAESFFSELASYITG